MAIFTNKKFLLELFVWGWMLRAVVNGRVVWEGDPFSLRCGHADCPVNADLYWQKKVSGTWMTFVKRVVDEAPLIVEGFGWKGSEIEIDEKGVLKIQAASRERDTGTFNCKCQNEHRYTDVYVYEKVESVKVSGPPLPVSANRSVVFTCEAVGGHPHPNLTWEIPNTPTPKEAKTDYTSEISLALTKEMHGTTVECTASQLNYSISDGFKLDIIYKPVVSIESVRSDYEEDESVVLMCSADSNPEAEYTWITPQNDLSTEEPNFGTTTYYGVGEKKITPQNDLSTEEPDFRTTKYYGVGGQKTTTKTSPISDNTTNRVESETGQLLERQNMYTISSFSLLNVGRYVCIAENSEGAGYDWIDLTLKIPGFFEEHLFRKLALMALSGVLGFVVVGFILWQCVKRRKARRENTGRDSDSAAGMEMSEIAGDRSSYLHPVCGPTQDSNSSTNTDEDDVSTNGGDVAGRATDLDSLGYQSAAAIAKFHRMSKKKADPQNVNQPNSSGNGQGRTALFPPATGYIDMSGIASPRNNQPKNSICRPTTESVPDPDPPDEPHDPTRSRSQTV